MLNKILRIMGISIIVVFVGIFLLGFFSGESETQSSYSEIEVISKDITIKNTLNNTLADNEGYNFVNNTEYGLGVEVPDGTYSEDIFSANSIIVINGTKYTIIDYIIEDKRDFIALEPI